MNEEKVRGLLYQALDTERGGIQIYTTALTCARNEDLRKQWSEYLDQTHDHEKILLDVFEKLGLDPEAKVPGRLPVQHIGQSLVKAMQMAQKEDPEGSELVACECVVLAETKDHLNWELLSQVAKNAAGDTKKVLTAACDEVEDEEDEHLYHTTGFCRELHLKSLGLPAVIPPPEEKKDVKTAIGAERAKQSREDMLKGNRKRGQATAR